MEEELSLPRKLLIFLKRNLLISVMFSVGLICLLIGLIQYFLPKSDTVVFEASKEVSASETEAKKDTIFVDVSGEVDSPGLYEFKSEARVKDALDKAGGFTSDADQDYISKNLNLAAKLSDGMKIYIPKVGEVAPLVISSNSESEHAVLGTSTLISINTSSASEIETLPGVGPVTAQKIISNRPYASLEELVSKKSVGQSLFSKIKDQISL